MAPACIDVSQEQTEQLHMRACMLYQTLFHLSLSQRRKLNEMGIAARLEECLGSSYAAALYCSSIKTKKVRVQLECSFHAEFLRD